MRRKRCKAKVTIKTYKAKLLDNGILEISDGEDMEVVHSWPLKTREEITRGVCDQCYKSKETTVEQDHS
jgi:hypothetical protein